MFFFSISATTMCQIGFFFSVEQPTRWKPAAIFLTLPWYCLIVMVSNVLGGRT